MWVMIRDKAAWEAFEKEWERRHAADWESNWRVFEALLEHARALGVWPPADPLEGLDVDIRVARIVNTYVRDTSRSTRDMRSDESSAKQSKS